VLEWESILVLILLAPLYPCSLFQLSYSFFEFGKSKICSNSIWENRCWYINFIFHTTNKHNRLNVCIYPCVNNIRHQAKTSVIIIVILCSPLPSPTTNYPEELKKYSYDTVFLLTVFSVGNIPIHTTACLTHSSAWQNWQSSQSSTSIAAVGWGRGFIAWVLTLNHSNIYIDIFCQPPPFLIFNIRGWHYSSSQR